MPEPRPLPEKPAAQLWLESSFKKMSAATVLDNGEGTDNQRTALGEIHLASSDLELPNLIYAMKMGFNILSQNPNSRMRVMMLAIFKDGIDFSEVKPTEIANTYVNSLKQILPTTPVENRIALIQATESLAPVFPK